MAISLSYVSLALSKPARGFTGSTCAKKNWISSLRWDNFVGWRLI